MQLRSLCALASLALVAGLAAPSVRAVPLAIAVVPFAECGTLVQGVTCPLMFLSDSGLLLVLDNLGSFKLNDRVHVSGDYDAGCFSACNQGNGCVFNTVIVSCDGQNLGTNYCGPAVPNSSGQSATISAFGPVFAVANDLTLTASLVPANQFGYFLASETQDLVASPPGSMGNLCLGGQIARFAKLVQNSGGAGTFSIVVDLTGIPTNPPSSVMAGETWNFQAWFRDSAALSSNFTDGIAVTFQ